MDLGFWAGIWILIVAIGLGVLLYYVIRSYR